MVKIIAGLMGSSVAAGSSRLASVDQLRTLLQTCKKYNVLELDTARVYNAGKSEETLGAIPEAQQQFAIQTKCPGFSPGSLSKEKVTSNCNDSLEALKQSQIDIYYFHGPDRKTPLSESCSAINTLYQQDKFRRFGVSNFRADEVEEIVSICKQQGWVLPAVYQGGYNPLLRTGEKALFPTLRRHGISFYAYSPLGGGYFSRPMSELRQPPSGSRMDEMAVFKNIYVNDDSLRLHDVLTNAVNKHNVTLREATLRWLMHHSILEADDGVILGASSAEQMQANLEASSHGPLPDDLVKVFEDVWEQYNATGKAFGYSV
ncbi:NADP-dependent oxidoreductase domain-containing protein [Elsinoe ampelina]|uniref:NADP-dependent oxidoreductase domain-containing protein n=1 Tax=Elsinoe ampelina TaxID=302913 RepID=A0A6A6G9G3_9PEZI|nr:NADP-dependent oxidoreductase domain-containing protein [Elsinoe ampelina]